ncbi:hypothetical protein E2C01_019506 [Portunus trituberculatus]|uniref:Uncharacterized protein n=1 Tax=Portunus trituberculatus TaxID=210409 RepID=A0A5B7DXE2_PORTR|nr:hypothetical protein [Portunus trituberculatus]
MRIRLFISVAYENSPSENEVFVNAGRTFTVTKDEQLCNIQVQLAVVVVVVVVGACCERLVVLVVLVEECTCCQRLLRIGTPVRKGTPALL